MATIYKICPASLWRAAEKAGVFRGSEADLSDGFIHFSTAAQVAETAAKHFAGVSDLVLVALDETHLRPLLRYQPARGGAMFPHLHGPLDPRAALWVRPLAIGPDGRHVFPDLAP